VFALEGDEALGERDTEDGRPRHLTNRPHERVLGQVGHEQVRSLQHLHFDPQRGLCFAVHALSASVVSNGNPTEIHLQTPKTKKIDREYRR
jgi:hypothetical protein